MPSRLEEKLLSGQRVLTAEISPPKGSGIKKLSSHALAIKDKVDAINITDCQRALVKMASWAACKVLLDLGCEPVMQLTCRDRNRIALQSDLMGASAIGIRNLLCLTGDPVKVGDCTDAKSVFEIESVKMLHLVRKLQSGHDDGGRKMNAPTKFFAGSTINPTMAGQGSQLSRLEKKIEAGANFFQTQANYDTEDSLAFLEKAKSMGAKVIFGVLLLHDVDTAQYIRDHIPAIRIPDSTFDRIKNSTDTVQTGIDIAVELMTALESVSAGFHLMTIREEHLLPRWIEAYGKN